jgi:hypothetical protein
LAQKVLLGNLSIKRSLISITDQEFKQLEEICGFPLNETARFDLREIKKVHLTMAMALSKAPSVIEVQSELLKLKNAATEAALSARLLGSGQKPTESMLLHFSGLPPDQLKAFAALANEISRRCQKACQEMESRTSKVTRGRARHPQLREYISELAEFFERRGGKVSANYSDVEGSRNTRFVKFIWHLSAGMSAELRWPQSMSAMGEAVNKALKQKKAAGQLPSAGSN